MARARPVCTSPYHLGDMLTSRLDAFERRIEFRRLYDQGREATVLDRIVCRACMRIEIAERRNPRMGTLSLLPDEQGEREAP